MIAGLAIIALVATGLAWDCRRIQRRARQAHEEGRPATAMVGARDHARDRRT